MPGRDSVLAALRHRQPDRVPVDLGSTAVTGVHVSSVAALRDWYGLEKRQVKVHEPYQMLGWLDEDLKQAMGIDVEGVFPFDNLFGFRNEGWKPWRTPWGQEVLVPAGFLTVTDASGAVLIFPQGDPAAPPSGRMPEGSRFFDTIVRQPPVDDDRLDPADNLEEFVPASSDFLTHLTGAARIARQTGRAVISGLPGTAFGDIALVPAPFLKQPKGIRDIAEWYVSTRSRRDYIHKVFARQCEIAVANLARIHEAVGDMLDAVFVCGTDFGTQTSAFCSVATLRELYLPYYREVNGWIHHHTNWSTFKHSCGAVEKFLDAFIEAGFDILNPVQCSAAGMDPRLLKSSYGDRLVFWGGGVDTQRVLPFGTPAEVREHVLDRCEVFGAGGGFVFNPVHNIQASTPVENIAAMIDAVHEFNGGPSR
jgi:hypothetical protein